MEFEEQKRVVREQRAGYAILRQFEIDEMRRATFEDRLAAFAQIMRFSRYMKRDDSRSDDDDVTAKWMKIRARYDAADR